VDFVEEGDGTILVGKVADLSDRTNATTHRVDALERDDLGRIDWELGELRLEVGEIVVLEDNLLGARVANTLNHRGVVERIGEDDAAGKFGRKSAHCSPAIVSDCS